jgi:hypothetical protein
MDHHAELPSANHRRIIHPNAVSVSETVGISRRRKADEGKPRLGRASRLLFTSKMCVLTAVSQSKIYDGLAA